MRIFGFAKQLQLRHWGLRARGLLALGLLVALPACGGAPAVDPSVGSVESALSSTTNLYYTMRPDTRRCLSPVCGGWFIKRPNFATTKCVDGVYRAECYVASVDLSGFDLGGASGAVIVRGVQTSKSYGRFGSYGLLTLTEAWEASSSSPGTGTFYRLSDAGIRCITTPCPNIREEKLNSRTTNILSDVTGRLAGDALAAFSQGPILVAGTNHTSHGSLSVAITQYYTPLVTSIDPNLFCHRNSDCVATAYYRPVSETSDCYCLVCLSAVLNRDAAAANGETFDQYCSDVHKICPLACRRPPVPACHNHVCVDTLSGP